MYTSAYLQGRLNDLSSVLPDAFVYVLSGCAFSRAGALGPRQRLRVLGPPPLVSFPLAVSLLCPPLRLIDSSRVIRQDAVIGRVQRPT